MLSLFVYLVSLMIEIFVQYLWFTKANNPMTYRLKLVIDH